MLREAMSAVAEMEKTGGCGTEEHDAIVPVGVGEEGAIQSVPENFVHVGDDRNCVEADQHRDVRQEEVDYILS